MLYDEGGEGSGEGIHGADNLEFSGTPELHLN